jgi:hypothetical protein
VARDQGGRIGFYGATGIVGALGICLFRLPIKRWWLRWPARLIAWPLCLLGLIWLVRGGVFLGLAVCLPQVIAHLSVPWFTDPNKIAWRPGRYTFLLLCVPAFITVVNLPKVAGALGEAVAGVALLCILLFPIVTDLPLTWRFRLATVFLGSPGPEMMMRHVQPWWLRWPTRCFAWLLCLYQSVAFLAFGWLLTPAATYGVLGFPIALTHLIEQVFYKPSGPDWYRAGFRLATGFVGEMGLSLYRRDVKQWWLRWFIRWLAWPVCLLGLLWFRMGGFFAFILIPYLRQGKRLRAAPLLPPEPDYRKRSLLFRLEPLDYVSLAIIFVVGLGLFLVRQKLVTFAPDGYYHLLVARRIAEDGLVLRPELWDYVREGIVPRWDFWEYAPMGRPHLYPPLLHLLIALCSLPFNKDVEAGMKVMQIVVFPGVLFSTWYLGRWLFDAPRGFVAMLLTGSGFFFVIISLFALPSILANAIAPFLLILFLTRRFFGATVLLTIILYAHMGVGALTVAGLFLFSLWRREYFKFALGVLGLSVFIALPWYGHMWIFRDWLGNPMASQIGTDIGSRLMGVYMKMKWLLMLDLVVVLLVIRAWKMIPWFETRYCILLCMLIGFLPMFFEYGGRYCCHTVQIWAIVAAVPLVRFLAPPLKARRVALFMALAFLFPPLSLSGSEGSIGLKMHPFPSGWTMAGIVMINGNSSFGDDEEGELQYAEAVALGTHIKENTSRDQIIHILVKPGDHKKAHMAVTLGYHADRRIDEAAWPEVRPADPDLAAKALDDPQGCYVTRNRELLPEDLQVTELDGHYIGIRVLE